MDKIIKSARIEQPKSIFDDGAKIYGTYEDGTEEYIVNFYPNEISIHVNEVIGKTKSEVIELKCKKDADYLRS